MMSRVRTIFFFFNDTATTEIYTLSLHDALPIFVEQVAAPERGDLDERLVLIQAELLDAEGLRVVVGGDVPELAAAADVQHELAAHVGIPVSGQRHGAARATAQEHRLGQLQNADLEARRLLDREEPEVDLHRHF